MRRSMWDHHNWIHNWISVHATTVSVFFRCCCTICSPIVLYLCLAFYLPSRLSSEHTTTTTTSDTRLLDFARLSLHSPGPDHSHIPTFLSETRAITRSPPTPDS